jgi:hypothetical protein
MTGSLREDAVRMKTTFRSRGSWFAVLATAVAVCGCNGDQLTGAATTTTTVELTTEVFSGTLAVGSAATHLFAVAQTGEVKVTLTAAGPPSTIFMGIGVGTPVDSSCEFLEGRTGHVQAGASPQVDLANTAPGLYCVSVYDIGNQAVPIDYSVTVEHP